MLESDRELGALLSGGLDSSLVVSIASKYLHQFGKRLKTFSIGLPGSTDKEYAEMVATFCNTDHTHIELTTEYFLSALKHVIYATETFDITTIRASTGQYLVSKWISEHTNIKVLLIGDGSDELTAGYMYFHKAPSPTDLHIENKKLLTEIHFYDVLRADRGIATHGLEARVPFLDHRFVDLYMSLDPSLRIPTESRIEKWLLRKSFDTGRYLPAPVLWRKKEAFSDGVSSVQKSWYQIVQESAEQMYTDEQLASAQQLYTHCPPPTKEALYFRDIFESLYPNTSHVIPHYWLPNWCGDIKEPSARVLDVYK
jgi:asparagine synthase (glutamine-hydrolysing)